MSSKLCGPNSVCKNLPVRSQYSCISIFSPPTGKSWILGSLGHFLCTGNVFRLSAMGGTLVVGAWFSSLILFLCPADIDECLKSGICPANSNCSNSVGSYKCTCQPGFFWNGLVCEGLWHLVFVISHMVLSVSRTEPKG